MSSTSASLAGRFATPGNAIYGATKHAVVAFSEAMNYETEGRNVYVTSVNPGFVDTEGFPQGDLPDWAVLKMRTVTDAIVKVVQEDIAPEYSIPRWLSPLQAFRVLTPPLYRWGIRRVRRTATQRTTAMRVSASRPWWSPPAEAGTWWRSTAPSPTASGRST